MHERVRHHVICINLKSEKHKGYTTIGGGTISLGNPIWPLGVPRGGNCTTAAAAVDYGGSGAQQQVGACIPVVHTTFLLYIQQHLWSGAGECTAAVQRDGGATNLHLSATVQWCETGVQGDTGAEEMSREDPAGRDSSFPRIAYQRLLSKPHAWEVLVDSGGTQYPMWGTQDCGGGEVRAPTTFLFLLLTPPCAHPHPNAHL